MGEARVISAPLRAQLSRMKRGVLKPAFEALTRSDFGVVVDHP
jgi:hypothetical protein